MRKNRKLWLLLAAAIGLIVAITAQGLREDLENDPDLPAGYTGHFDSGEYLKQREAFIALRRGVDPTRPADPAARSRAINLMDAQIAAIRERIEKSHGNEAEAFPNWLELGPNPIPLGQTDTTRVNVSGRISAIEIDPTDPNKVYVGAAQGGVYRSLDGGTTWGPIFDTAQSLAIGCLTLDPANNVLWVGTGEANGSADSFACVVLYRIENVNTTANLVGPINPIRNYNDGGGNPVSSGFFSGRSISKILIVPNDHNTLFVGIAGGAIGIGGNPPLGNTIPPLAMRGMAKISNALGPIGGITGARIPVSTVDAGVGACGFDLPCTVNRNVNDLVFDPQDPTGNTLVVWMNGINVANDGGIWRSTNAMSGAPTFTQTLVTTATSTSTGRGELRAFISSNVFIHTVMYVASGEPSNVPANATLCNNAGQSGALRRSDDGGVTWTAKLQGGGGFCGAQCFYNIGFALVPGVGATPDKLHLGGNVNSGVCQRQHSPTQDGGATTLTDHSATTHADTHVIKIAPSNANIVWRGDDGGVWKSTDGGDTWTQQNNSTMRATQFQSIALHPTDPDISIGGTQDNGTDMLLAGGASWLHSDDGDGGFAMIDQSTPATMYHTFFNRTGAQIGYSRSLTGGTFGSWSFLGCVGNGTTNGVSCNPAITTAVNFYCPTALGPGSPNNTVYLGTDRLLRSSTQGTANATVSQAPIVSGVPISNIAISPQDDNYRIVGLNNGALFFTTTGSAVLTSLDPTGGGSAIPDFYVGRLIFDPTNKNTVYIGLGNFSGGTSAAQSHMWRITNLDTTPVKTAINGSGITGLPDVPINGLAVDPLKPLRLFVGTDIGVYISENGGTSWSPYGQGLPRVAVFDMAIQNVKRVLRIATHGRGMWEIPLLAPTAAPARISGRVTDDNGAPLAGVTMRLNGPISVSTITDSNGNYQFSAMNTGNLYTITPELANYHFSPSDRTLSLMADQTDAVFTGSLEATVSANAIDTSEYFVRQHYLDFLGREPDSEGLRFWNGQLNDCHGDAACIRTRRIDISAEFFRSREFQDSAAFVYRLYKGALGRQLRYGEFSADRAQVIGGPNLDDSKAAFADAFVQRAAFTNGYQGDLTANTFVDALLATVHDGGADLSSRRAELIDRYSEGRSLNASRALVLRDLADNNDFAQATYNQSFVLFEYFGYLRRDIDQQGYAFWLSVLDHSDAGNYRGMVCSFITSAEYQRRFGTVVTRSNAECGQ